VALSDRCCVCRSDSIAAVLVASLTSDAALRKSFELVATQRLAQPDLEQPRRFIGTRATVGSIDGVGRFHEPRTLLPFHLGWRCE
jgi:hypothetical protein